MYEVEHIGPPPPITRGKYPFARLKVNASFFVPNGDRDRIHGSKGYWERKLGRSFTVRTVAGGVRVWRVS